MGHCQPQEVKCFIEEQTPAMEGSAAVSQSQSGNNAGCEVFLDPVRERIDFSQMTVWPICAAVMTALSADENVNESTTDTIAPTGATQTQKSQELTEGGNGTQVPLDFVLLNGLVKQNMPATEKQELHQSKFLRHGF